jgi:hypothetical protein
MFSLENEDHEMGVSYIKIKTIVLYENYEFFLTAPCRKCDRPYCVIALGYT